MRQRDRSSNPSLLWGWAQQCGRSTEGCEEVSEPIELPRRNAQAVMAALSTFEQLIRAQQQRIDGLNATISTLYERIGILERMVALQKSLLMGHGPTVT